MRSQMILIVATSGTASSAPGTRHIQHQKGIERMPTTWFSVKRHGSSIGVTICPSMKWMTMQIATGSSAP